MAAAACAHFWVCSVIKKEKNCTTSPWPCFAALCKAASHSPSAHRRPPAKSMRMVSIVRYVRLDAGRSSAPCKSVDCCTLVEEEEGGSLYVAVLRGDVQGSPRKKYSGCVSCLEARMCNINESSFLFGTQTSPTWRGSGRRPSPVSGARVLTLSRRTSRRKPSPPLWRLCATSKRQAPMRDQCAMREEVMADIVVTGLGVWTRRQCNRRARCSVSYPRSQSSLHVHTPSSYFYRSKYYYTNSFGMPQCYEQRTHIEGQAKDRFCHTGMPFSLSNSWPNRNACSKTGRTITASASDEPDEVMEGVGTG
jgi:hypothetical protein